jgi:hypothetical protein
MGNPFCWRAIFSTFGKVEISQHSKAKNPWHDFCHIFAWDWDSQQITFIEESSE